MSHFVARDEYVAAHGTRQQSQQLRIRQLTDSCINVSCLAASVIFVNENENGEKRENNKFVNAN